MQRIWLYVYYTLQLPFTSPETGNMYPDNSTS